MNSKTCLMIAAAILLIVYNLMNKDGSVSQIADMDESEVIDRAANVGDMSGFATQADIAVIEEDADLREPEQQARAVKADTVPVVADYSPQPSTRPSSIARIERPAHHNLKPGQDTAGFDPTIR